VGSTVIDARDISLARCDAVPFGRSLLMLGRYLLWDVAP
jgi:hypothetical protein